MLQYKCFIRLSDCWLDAPGYKLPCHCEPVRTLAWQSPGNKQEKSNAASNAQARITRLLWRAQSCCIVPGDCHVALLLAMTVVWGSRLHLCRGRVSRPAFERLVVGGDAHIAPNGIHASMGCIPLFPSLYPWKIRPSRSDFPKGR